MSKSKDKIDLRINLPPDARERFDEITRHLQETGRSTMLTVAARQLAAAMGKRIVAVKPPAVLEPVRDIFKTARMATVEAYDAAREHEDQLDAVTYATQGFDIDREKLAESQSAATADLEMTIRRDLAAAIAQQVDEEMMKRLPEIIEQEDDMRRAPFCGVVSSLQVSTSDVEIVLADGRDFYALAADVPGIRAGDTIAREPGSTEIIVIERAPR